jgi:serine phosphatase RsbU (regulator of sigma subunit)
MSNRSRSRVVPAAAVAFAVSLYGFLYGKTRAVDMDAHVAFTGQLAGLQHLSTVLKQETLASRFGLLNQYDELTATKNEMTASLGELRPRLGAIPYASPETERRLGELERTERDLRDAVERFKTANSVLRNSLYYLPTAGDTLVRDLVAAGASPAALPADVTRLVQTVLVYNLIKGESVDQLLERHAALAARVAEAPPELRQAFTLFLKHAARALREHEVVDPLIDEISSPSADRAAAALQSSYEDDFERQSSKVDRYRIALYAWSGVLLLVTVWVGLRLRRLYSELESRVKDRTARLDAALTELWGEMELAKKIQKALVPASPSLDNCDVAAVMRPADQVGGDYYDVFREGAHEWILIGDVSGHGVPAGLIMMMCQTAVRTALASNPGLLPDELLVIVNRTLTENIRRLNEDKYVTISALCRDQNGRFHHAGLHQDLLIYRAKTGTVDCIPSEGAWLGLTEDIDHLLTVGTFELAPGDVLFLYTDGITEAVNVGDGKMLDNCGLMTLLEELGQARAGEIVTEVVARLEGYAISDDVAAVAVKQC